MAQPRVAVLAEIAVDIVLARNRQLVDAVGVARPLQIEVLPEGRRAEVEHAAPVAADHVERAGDIAGFGAGQQHEVAVEGADAVIGPVPHDFVVQLPGVADAAENLHRRGDLVAAAVRRDRAQLRSRHTAAEREARIVQL